MDDRHDFHHQSKRHCTQRVGQSHEYGTVTLSTYIPSSLETQYGALDKAFDGAANTLHQPNLDVDLHEYLEQQHAAELPFWSDRHDFSSGYPAHQTLNAATPVQSFEVETFATGVGFSWEHSMDENLFNNVTQTNSDSNIEFMADDIGQNEVALLNEFTATMTKKEYVHETSKPPSLLDDYTDITLQPAGDSPQKSEQADLISQERRVPIIQALGIATSECVDTVVENEKIYRGQACVQSKSVIDPYDACFGVIVADALSSFTGDQDSYSAPVNMKPYGDILKLYFQDSNKYAGILAIPALCRLLEQFSVKFNAILVTSPSKPSSTTVRNTKNSFANHKCSVRIVLHGIKGDISAVSDVLSNAALYLQHPSAIECDIDAEYCNPHYLVRPGSQLPLLEELSISSFTSTIKASETLDEVERGKLLRVFDSTDEFGVASHFIASPRLRSALKDHQLTALFMMTEKECGTVGNATFPSIWELNPQTGTADKYRHKITGARESSPRPVQSGVLADEMGLGKTLSLLALICSSLDSLNDRESREQSGISCATLVVTPKSTIPGWLQQIDRHIYPGQLRVAVYHGSSRHHLSSTLRNNDLILTTYETLRSDWQADGALYSAKWYRLVLDEAHHIRNRSSQAFKAACAIHSQRRWCLTGTPIQNSLDDYGALLSFLAIPQFRDKSKFDFWIATPLKRRRADGMQRLKDLIRATCLRRTKRTLGTSCELPKRIERIEPVNFHEADQVLYDFFKDKCAKMAQGVSTTKQGSSEADQRKGCNLLSLITFLQLICDHGEQLLPQPALNAWKTRDDTSINWQTVQSCRKSCCICESDIGEADFLTSNGYESRCQHCFCTACALQSESTSGEEGFCPKCATSPSSPADSGFPSPADTCLPPSAKIEALLQNLHAEQAVGTSQASSKPVKSVVFSRWTKMLDLIQQTLQKHGFRSLRIDGKTSLENRSKALIQFDDDPSYTVMLASIGSAGEGIDLTAANHVHLIEPQWNPMVEAQAVDRVHRIGQEREVVITRYVMLNSIEQYIQKIQDEKLQLINQSIDSEHSSQDYTENNQWEKLKSFLT